MARVSRGPVRARVTTTGQRDRRERLRRARAAARCRSSTTTATSTSPTADGRLASSDALAAAAAVGVTRHRAGRLRPRERALVRSRSPREHDDVVAARRAAPERGARARRRPASPRRGARRDRRARRAIRGCAPSARPGSTSSAPATTGRARAGGVVPRAHRAGEAARQGAGDPRPRRARRRARACSTTRARRSASCSTASPATPTMARHCVERGCVPVLRRHRDVQERRSRCARRSPSRRSTGSWSRPTRPYLTPMPYRGRPNASYLVPLTVRAMAEVTGAPEDELCASDLAAQHRAHVFGPDRSWAFRAGRTSGR